MQGGDRAPAYLGIEGGMGLCKSTLPQMGRALRPQEKDILRYLLSIFVVGGPGCEKGTQCRNMAMKYGFYHVELGQLLREEAQRSTQKSRQIRDIMQKGLLLPTGLILDMVSDNLSYPKSRGFLIDGFPRELEQAKEFERIVGRAPNIVIVFDCSMETMVRRVLRRGQVEHWADDSELAIRKRLETHYTLCEPVLTFYQQKNLLRHILAEEAPESTLPSAVQSLRVCSELGRTGPTSGLPFSTAHRSKT